MFVGNKAGQLTYYKNTGSNISPTWGTGVIVRDSSNNTIDVSGNAKPNFANIRGLDPPRYDLFIGDGSGTIIYYHNNGLQGPSAAFDNTGANLSILVGISSIVPGCSENTVSDKFCFIISISHIS